MKKTTLILLTAFLFSCNSTYIKYEKHLPTDTVFTVISATFDISRNDHRTTVAKKYYKDTVQSKTTDESNGKTVIEKVSIYDSFYLVPIQVVDTSVKKTDSLGKLNQRIEWLFLPKELLLQDYNKNFK